MADEEKKEGAPEPDKPATTPDGRIHVRAPTGEYGTIDASRAAYAAANGYKILNEQDYQAREYAKREGFGGAAKAFVENAASTGTLGGSDVLAGAIGGNEYRHNRALREIAYPGASTAGEVTGMVLPALIPGGAEAEAAEGLAHGAQAVEATGVLGKAARGIGTAIRSGPAGLALRAGEGVSELAGRGLEHLGVTGESLLGRAARSGIRGAAGGATEGAAFGAGGALSEAALAPDGDYDGLAQKLWAGAIHGAEFGGALGGGLGVGGELATAAARKLAGTFHASDLLRDVGDAKTLKSLGYDKEEIEAMQRERPEVARKLAEQGRREESIGWSDSMRKKADKLEQAHADAIETLGTARKGLDELREPGDGVHLREALDDATKRTEDLKGAEGFKAKLREFQETLQPAEPASFEAAHDFRQTLDEELRKIRREGPSETERELTRIRTELDQRIEADTARVMEKATPEFREQYEAAKSRHAALEEIAPVAKAKAAEIENRPGVPLVDQVAAVTGFATMGPKGLLAAAARRALRTTQADHVIGKLASELAELDTHVNRSMAKWGAESRKAARGVTTGTAAHHSVVKHALEKGAEAAKATTSSTLHVRSEAGEQREHVREYFEKLHAVEQEAKSAPGTLVHIQDAPKTAEAAENVRRRQANWLLSQAPKPPAKIENPILARIARQTPPNVVDSLKWMRKVRTIENPRTAVTALQQGRLTTDHVAALEQMPVVLQMFRKAAIEQVTEHNADMSYQSRIQLGVLLGVTTDPSLRPESIAAGQAVYAKNRAAQKPAQSPQPQQPVQSIPGKRPAGFDSSLDQMEANSGKVV